MKKPRKYKEYFRHILKKKNVVGVGLGYKEIKGKPSEEMSIVALVRRKVPAASLKKADRVPPAYENFLTDVQEAGEFRLLDYVEEGEQETRQKRVRPAVPGVSIGHHLSTAGTLGAVVADKKTGKALLLSNNHVLANISDSRDGRAARGDDILQPGPIDGGKAGDVLARLERFVPLWREGSSTPSCSISSWLVKTLNGLFLFKGQGYQVRIVRAAENGNLVDAAVALPLEEKSVHAQVLGLGTIKGTGQAQIGETVFKSGRTTGITFGRVKVLEASVWVDVSPQSRVLMHEQILTEAMAKPGDSGSVLLNAANEVVGLIMAGSEVVTISNKVDHVETLLDVKF